MGRKTLPAGVRCRRRLGRLREADEKSRTRTRTRTNGEAGRTVGRDERGFQGNASKKPMN